MKIAAVSSDGITISQHFGRAPYYEVVEVEDGAIVRRERRDKLGHAQFGGQPHHDHAPGERHGLDPAAQGRHAQMLDAIRDCDFLLARGMGAGAYESARRAGIRPIVTDEPTIELAVRRILDGTIQDHVERLH